MKKIKYIKNSPSHLLVITPGFPATNKSKPGIAVLRAIRELDMDIDVIVPATIMKNPENVLVNGRVHWVTYMPRALCLLQGTKGDGGIPVRLKSNPLYLLLVPFLMIALFIRALKLTRKNSIIHAQWLPMAFIAALIKVIRHNPILVTIRGADQVLWGKKILNPIIKWIFNSTDAVVTVSKTLADEISSKFQIPEKTYFIPNGVSIPREKMKEENNNYVFLFAGSLIPRKGVEVLIKAFIKVNSKLDAKLVIGGDGLEKKRLESLVQENKISDNIKFLGEIPSNEVQNQMLKSKCFVLPSFSEGTPNVIKEAMACSIPVIATNISGNPELVKHGKTGLLFEPGDIETLAKHLCFAINNPNKMEEMGREAKDLIISKKLTWGNTEKMYSRVYKKIQKSATTNYN